jgi:hypothetical protein
LEQVANIVNQRIVPELKDQIVQAIEALQKTPSSSSTPDTEQNLSGSNPNTTTISIWMLMTILI